MGEALRHLGQAQSIKTTFCLIDWYKLDDKSPMTERVYWECATSYQGISPGWVDQYHQELEGQQLDLTGAPPGVYYLVSTANPDGVGELPAPARQPQEPLDRRDRPLAVRYTWDVRPAGDKLVNRGAPGCDALR